MIERISFRGLRLRKVRKTKNNPNPSLWVYGQTINIDEKTGHAFVGGVSVIPETIGQYSEVNDRKGHDIYEEDLLEVWNGATDDYKHMLVRIHRHGPSFNAVEPLAYNTIISEPVPGFIRSTGLIVGNAHELSKKEILALMQKIDEDNKRLNRI